MSKNTFIRDPEVPGVVLNTDNDALKAYRLKKQKEMKDIETANEVKNVKKEIADIKEMLNLILEKIK